MMPSTTVLTAIASTRPDPVNRTSTGRNAEAERRSDPKDPDLGERSFDKTLASAQERTAREKAAASDGSQRTDPRPSPTVADRRDQKTDPTSSTAPGLDADPADPADPAGSAGSAGAGPGRARKVGPKPKPDRTGAEAGDAAGTAAGAQPNPQAGSAAAGADVQAVVAAAVAGTAMPTGSTRPGISPTPSATDDTAVTAAGSITATGPASIAAGASPIQNTGTGGAGAPAAGIGVPAATTAAPAIGAAASGTPAAATSATDPAGTAAVPAGPASTPGSVAAAGTPGAPTATAPAPSPGPAPLDALLADVTGAPTGVTVDGTTMPAPAAPVPTAVKATEAAGDSSGSTAATGPATTAGASTARPTVSTSGSVVPSTGPTSPTGTAAAGGQSAGGPSAAALAPSPAAIQGAIATVVAAGSAMPVTVTGTGPGPGTSAVNPAVDAAAAAGPISGTGFPGKDVARSADDSDPDGPVPGQVAFQAPQPVPPATATATSAPATTGVPAALSTQVAEQVNRQLLGARALRDGSHRAVIRLSPEHLGDVTITLNVHAGSVRMDLLAGPTAIGALQANLHDLRDQMAQSGLRLDDVSLRQSGLPNTDAGASNGQNTPQGNPGPPSRGDSGERRAGPGAIGVTPPGSGSRPARPSSGNRLDVLI